MRTIILAGGYATRLFPLTIDRPKPLLPVDGRPIVEHILSSGHLPDTPILSTNRRFASHFEGWKARTGANVDILIEDSSSEQEKLGTIGALAYAVQERNIRDDLLVIAGDNIFGFALDKFLAAYDGSVLIALHDIADPERVRNRYGVAIVQGDSVVGFQEKPDHPRSSLVSTACYVYPQGCLWAFEEFARISEEGRDAPGYLNEWLLNEQGMKIKPFVFDAPWFDIGDRASYIAAHREITQTKNWVAEEATVQNSSIDDSVILAGAKIRGCTLQGCVVAEGVELEGVTLVDALVGERTRIRVTE